MKRHFLIWIVSVLPALVNGQLLPHAVTKQLANAPSDSARYNAYLKAYGYFAEKNRDSALYYISKGVDFARQSNQRIPVAYMLDMKAYQLTGSGRYADALKCLLVAFDICNDANNAVPGWLRFPASDPERVRLIVLSFTHHIYGILMERAQNTEQEILHFRISKSIGRKIGFILRIKYADLHLAPTYLELGKIDSALVFANEAMYLTVKTKDPGFLGNILGCLGDISLKKGDIAHAKKYYYKGVTKDIETGNTSDLTANYLKITNFYLASGQKDSSIYYALKTLKTFKTLGPTTGQQVNIGTAYEKLYKSYLLRQQRDSAVKYSTLALAANDSINKIRLASLSEFQNLSLKEQMRVQDLEKEKVVYQGRVRTFAMLAGLIVFLTIALILYRNNRQKQRANKTLENTLNELRSTQGQLVQREKMASLGELTAGIAHEIQNPLNFVNNFSEVNAELIDEMGEELAKGDIEEAKAIAGDIKDNLEKVRHHGKRADAIVKGMLQHSRASSGQKEPTDLNALADEYLRLAYHGLRAKEKNFNAELVTHFDENLPKALVVPQDIGRVLINMYNNAFYATQQKVKTANGTYKPEVMVATSAEDDQAIISIKDNGTGIPENIREKIMQPFFTTKPTGEGTGLGLSLSYDIIVKGHNGKIDVNTKIGEYSEFIVTLPLS